MRSRTVATVLSALALAAAPACAPGSAGMQSPAPAARVEVLRQTPAEITRTTASLRQVDDLPMYRMTYHGGYDAEAPLTDEELARPADGWACSLFHREGKFGRNFDWDPSPAMIVHARPPGGHASVSLADVSYLFEAGHGAPDLADPQDRRRLAHAVLAPFDGMNDQGLAIGLAAAPDARLPAARPGNATVGGLRIIRLVLDRAASVPEAIELMRRYDIDFTGGPQLHYLIADRAGRSAVVEYGEGRVNVLDERYLTNIALTGADRVAKLADRRYRLLAEGGRTEAMELLRKVAQPHTRWSVVYDLDAGTGRLVTGRRWDRVHEIGLAPEPPES